MLCMNVHKTIKTLKLIKIINVVQNQFMTFYLIFNFRLAYFLYFQKIIANSNYHNVKKQLEQKRSIPVVKGLISTIWVVDFPMFFYSPGLKQWVGRRLKL